MMACYRFLFSSLDGVCLLNEDGGLKVFFPNNSFVTNTTLTRTNTPRKEMSQRSELSQQAPGDDHIVCYGGDPQTPQVTWHNTSGPLQTCGHRNYVKCASCGPVCVRNGGIGQDPPLNGRTNIHMFTGSSGYVNPDLTCRISGGQSAVIGLYLKDGGLLYYMKCVVTHTQLH